MNLNIDKKFEKFNVIQSAIRTKLTKVILFFYQLEDTYSNFKNPICNDDKDRIKKDVEDLFNNRNEAFLFKETNTNYNNLFQTMLSSMKNKKVHNKIENRPIKSIQEIKIETPKLKGINFLYIS